MDHGPKPSLKLEIKSLMSNMCSTHTRLNIKRINLTSPNMTLTSFELNSNPKFGKGAKHIMFIIGRWNMYSSNRIKISLKYKYLLIGTQNTHTNNSRLMILGSHWFYKKSSPPTKEKTLIMNAYWGILLIAGSLLTPPILAINHLDTLFWLVKVVDNVTYIR